jgi:hypothetical protein
MGARKLAAECSPHRAGGERASHFAVANGESREPP